MKIPLFIVSLLFCFKLFAQDDIEFNSTWKYFDSNHIILNVLAPPPGYSAYYNCDSMLFVRGDFSDTIKIWTPGLEWAYTLKQFKELITTTSYGKNVFAKSIMSDGRILVDTYMETQFIFRNDSLYQIEDTVSKPQEYFDLIVKNMLGQIEDSVFRNKKDSIELIYKDRHAYVPKLIFAKDMFKSGKKKIKLTKKVNFKQDEIELENQWVEKQKKCYVIRINNRFEGEETTYAYAINEDMKFIWWQGCEKRK